MDMIGLLSALSAAPCISEHDGAASLALNEIRKYAPQAYTDRLGNLIAPIAPIPESGEHLMLEAHLDEIGFIVTAVDGDGFLHVGKVGGPDVRVLLGHEVTVYGKEELFGVFCCQPPHLITKEDYKKAPELDSLAIDIGFSHDRAAELVSPGDRVILRRTPAKLLGDRLTGKALDNRAGVVSILRALELLGGEKPRVGLTVLFSLGEELGERGATTGAFSIAPTQAVVIDVSHAYTPDAPREKCGDLGKGPMIGVSPILSREMTKGLIRLAQEKEIPYQKEIMGSVTGTDGDAVSISGAGVRTGLVSIPLRYMHTAAEVISASDIENTAKLLCACVLDAR